MNEPPPELTEAELRVRDYIRTLVAEIVRLNDQLAACTCSPDPTRIPGGST